MTIPTEGKLLRIFIGEADHWHGKPLYEAIVLEARKRGLAGATVNLGSGSAYGQLRFAGTQTLGGAGTVAFAGNTTYAAASTSATLKVAVHRLVK